MRFFCPRNVFSYKQRPAFSRRGFVSAWLDSASQAGWYEALWKNSLNDTTIMQSLACGPLDKSKQRWEKCSLVGSLQGRVTAARSWPLFREEKNHLRRCWKKLGGHNFDFRAKSSWEKIFNIYKNFLSGGFRSKVKIVTPQLFPTPTYFCWQLAFHRHLPTSGRQNRVKNLLYPPFIYIFWILSA